MVYSMNDNPASEATQELAVRGGYGEVWMETAIKLVEIAKRLYAKNMNAALGGNVSIRQGDEIAITPAGINKGFMTEDEVVVVDMEAVSYTHLRAHETRHDLVCRLLLEK